MTVLTERTRRQPWWLGYLDTGTNDIVLSDAPKGRLYADWPYVLIEAGPAPAAAWRKQSPGRNPAGSTSRTDGIRRVGRVRPGVTSERRDCRF